MITEMEKALSLAREEIISGPEKFKEKFTITVCWRGVVGTLNSVRLGEV